MLVLKDYIKLSSLQNILVKKQIQFELVRLLKNVLFQVSTLQV